MPTWNPCCPGITHMGPIYQCWLGPTWNPWTNPCRAHIYSPYGAHTGPMIECCLGSGADLGVGPEGHRPQLKSDWPLKCPCPVSHRWFTSSSLLAASVRRLKINLLNGFCLQLLVLCFQSRSSSPLREVPIQNFKVKKHIMVDVI